MNVLQVLSEVRLEEGGVVRCVLDLCPLLASRGHAVTLITWDDKDVPAHWKRDAARPQTAQPDTAQPDTAQPGAAQPGAVRSIRIDPPAGKMGLFTAAQIEKLRPLLRAHDIVHLHAMWTPSNIQIARAATRESVPYGVTVHGMLDDWCMAQKPLKKKIYLFIAGRKWLNRAAWVHCTAEEELRQAKRHFSNPRGVVSPVVFDLAAYLTLPGPDIARTKWDPLRTGRPVVLFLSRLHVKKGVEHLLRARALPDAPDYEVLIAGTGDPAYEAMLRSLTGQLNLTDRVHFLGMVSGTEKVSLFQAADLLVLPTSQENFGFALVESLACNTPVITTRGVDIWRELERTGAAAIVDPQPAAIAAAIRECLARRDSLKAEGAGGRAWVLEALAPDAIVRNFEQMYTAAIGTRRP